MPAPKPMMFGMNGLGEKGSIWRGVDSMSHGWLMSEAKVLRTTKVPVLMIDTELPPKLQTRTSSLSGCTQIERGPCPTALRATSWWKSGPDGSVAITELLSNAKVGE